MKLQIASDLHLETPMGRATGRKVIVPSAPYLLAMVYPKPPKSSQKKCLARRGNYIS